MEFEGQITNRKSDLMNDLCFFLAWAGVRFGLFSQTMGGQGYGEAGGTGEGGGVTH